MRCRLSKLLIIVLLMASCRPDPPLYPTPINTYLPVAKGNTWQYAYNVIGNSPDTMTVTMTGAKTPVGNSTYCSADCTTQQFPQFTVFYCAGKHLYTTLLAAATSGGAVIIQLNYLADSLSINQTWTNKLTPDGMVNGVPGQMLGTVLEKNADMQINGIRFRDVIHTRADVQYNFGDGFKTYTSYDYYSARGVGIVRITSAGADTLCKQEIIGYSVK